MRRLLMIAISAAILLLTFAPAAFAADPVQLTGRGAVVTVNGTVDVPAGQTVDAVVVVNGTATIAGTVNSVVVVKGTATMTGATIRHLVVVDGRADLGAGTTVTQTISTVRGTITQDPGAIVSARYVDLEADLGALAFAGVLLGVVFTLGFALLMLAVALVVAAFGARQVRDVEAVITEQPVQSFVAGLAGTIVLPLIGGILLFTVIGAPIGLALLFVALPMLALAGWLVAAVFAGDWIVERTSGRRESGRPYRAAIVGVAVLALAGMLPLVSGIATLFGVGAILVAAGRMLGGDSKPATAPQPPTEPAQPGWAQTMPAA